MIVSRLTVLLLLAQLLVGVAQASSDDAINWLNKMVDAVQMLNYEGTFVYLHDNQLETMSITHQYAAGLESEKLVSLNGEAREILRQGSQVTCVWPNSKSVIIELGKVTKSFPVSLPMDLQSLENVYRFQLGKEQRVANRTAQIVNIIPNDDLRFGFKLWLDKKTALPLKSIRLDEKGNTIEQILYTSLQVVDLIETNKLEIKSMGQSYSWVINDDKTEARPVSTSWQVKNLPVGYMLQQAKMEQVPYNDSLVEHLVYTDGLATVSVYIEPDSTVAASMGSSRMGALSAYGMPHGNYFVTVVGEVPEMTLKVIAKSLVKAKNGS
jgi:sigma-E factor negative regulatory protein RseB